MPLGILKGNTFPAVLQQSAPQNGEKDKVMEAYGFGSITLEDQVSPEFDSYLLGALNRGPVHIGPSHIACKPNEYFISPSVYGTFRLQCDNKGVRRLLSNICTHRHVPLMMPVDDWSTGYHGFLEHGHMVCPGHNLGFSASGKHRAPIELKVETDEYNTDLPSVPFEDVGGITWMGTGDQMSTVRELLELPLARELGVTAFIPPNYRLHEAWVDTAQFSAFDAMEVYEDCFHPRHKVHRDTLGRVIVPGEYKSDYSRSGTGSLQTMPWNSKCDYANMHPDWHMYHHYAHCFKQGGYTDPTADRVVWRAHYPDFSTNEWYRFMVVDSRFTPNPCKKGEVWNAVLFYFPKELDEFVDGGKLKHHAVAAYRGSRTSIGIAQEDGELARLSGQGKRLLTLFRRGGNAGGPMKYPEERAVQNLHRYVAQGWNAHKASLSR